MKIVVNKFSTFGRDWLPEQQQHLGTANVDTEQTDPARGSVSVTTTPARLATELLKYKELRLLSLAQQSVSLLTDN